MGKSEITIYVGVRLNGLELPPAILLHPRILELHVQFKANTAATYLDIPKTHEIHLSGFWQFLKLHAPPQIRHVQPLSP